MKVGIVGGHLRRPGRQGLAPLPRLGGGLLAQLALAGPEVPSADGRPELGVVLARLGQLDQPVHGAQPLEGVLAVEEPAVVDLAQVPLDVGAGQGGPAQDDRDVGQAAAVELLEVVAHDQGRLDQQAAHADGVGARLLEGADHVGDAHLDPEVLHRVAVVGEDDVDQVLADVVDVALDRGQHHDALAALVGLLHVGLEVGDGRLHGLGRAEHEGQLHLAGGEQLAHRLHAGQEEVVDDDQRRCARRPWPRRGRPRSRCGPRR